VVVVVGAEVAGKEVPVVGTGRVMTDGGAADGCDAAGEPPPQPLTTPARAKAIDQDTNTV
jgi:hypothetical protein